jgi:dTDP-4-amino-4,6-dideoxygalactose transaminase
VAKGIVVTRQSSERILLNDLVAQWREVGADAQAALARVGESGWLILGREVKSFEAELAAACQVPYVVGCANGLDAIEIALRVLGIAPGDKVITTPLSAFATTLAIVRAGGVPVFVDVDGSGLIDLESVADALSRDRSIKFCVPVHLYGHALDAQALQRIAALPGVQLVEDCAQAIGAAARPWARSAPPQPPASIPRRTSARWGTAARSSRAAPTSPPRRSACATTGRAPNTCTLGWA